MRIGVDLMGGDSSPMALFEAVIQASMKLYLPSITLVVFATPSIIQEIGGRHDWHERLVQSPVCIEFQSVSDVIEMADDPLLAIRRKKDSSLVVGIRLLKNHLLCAFVSSGNTGALIASASLNLPSLPGIERPALLALLPTAKGSVAVIDVGGTIACKALNLVQFASMGAAYQRCFHQIQTPTVGLLNIGVESKKGTSEVRQAYESLKARGDEDKGMRFVGNVEGREVFQGAVDVLVTDGFTGNVFLKTSEGVSSFILDHLKHAIDKSRLHELSHQFSYDEYPGAVICGVEGVVVKCHGQSTAKGMLNAILGAISLVKNDFVKHLKDDLQKPH